MVLVQFLKKTPVLVALSCTLSFGATGAAMLGSSHAAFAQTDLRADAADSQLSLQDALRRIARNSQDSRALADAGLAALALGDTRAAIGFLAKADQIYPDSGRVKAGLGRALLENENPFGALRYFDQAIANGIPLKDIARDRGLVYDLLGRTADAQKDYEVALRHNDTSDELLSRYAVSLGIGGDVEGADLKLNPLLQKSDRDAWRNRAFILAMNDQKKAANNIARQSMTKRMAKAIKPFFDRMSKLTAAQKAAAVHFGHFPASENIGVDVASVRYAANNAARGGDGADAGLIPLGEPLGEPVKKPRVLAMPDTSQRRRPGARRAGSLKQPAGELKVTERKATELVVLNRDELPKPTDRPIEPNPAASASREEVAAASAATKGPAAIPTTNPATNPATNPVKSPNPRPAPSGITPGFETALGAKTDKSRSAQKVDPPLVSASVERTVDMAEAKPDTGPDISPYKTPDTGAAPVASAAPQKPPASLINFDLANAGTQNAPPVSSRPVSSRTASSPAQPSAPRPLAAIMGSIAIPDEEKRSTVVPVDLASIEPAKPQPKAEPEPPPAPKNQKPKHPKRYWVQIATGADLSALKFDYRRFSRKNADLFKAVEGWTSPWGKTRRLVVGPFDDFKTAKTFEARYRKDGGDGFAWASADGVEVNKLPK